MPSNPEPTKISLTAEQLASLDLLIAKKTNDALKPGRYTDVVVTAATAAAAATMIAVGPEVAVATAVVGVAGVAANVANNLLGGSDAAEHEKVLAHLEEAARHMPLDTLLELRNRALKNSEE